MKSKASRPPTLSFLFRVLLQTLFIPIVFHSCTGIEESDHTIIDLETDHDIHTIIQFNNKIYASAGSVWESAEIITSSDGVTWFIDSLSDRAIFDLSATENNILAAGVGGYIFEGSNELNFHRIGRWGIQRSILSYNDSYLTVGGKDYNKGYIYSLNSEFAIDTTFDIDHQLSDALVVQEDRLIAVGFGIILESTNGREWFRQNQQGDFYTSIAKNDQGHIFITGLNGTLLKSTDNGYEWETLKNGHHPIASNKAFRKIIFQDEIGIIVGDNGLIWKSTDHGESWEDVSTNKSIDHNDAIVFKNKIFAPGNNGQITTLDL